MTENINAAEKLNITETAEAAKAKAEAEKAKKKEELEALHKRITSGVMKLRTPIRAESKDVTELRYDFSKVTGWEYVEAMDADRTAENVLRISSKQALCLFAVACAHEHTNLDARDIRERISAMDAMQATQIATLFTVTSAQVASINS